MPGSNTNTYPVSGWNSENFTGPLTGGSSGFINSLGVTFQETGAVEGDPGNWLTGWRPAADMSVTVSCSPWGETSVTDERGVTVRLLYPVLTVMSEPPRLITGGSGPSWELVCEEP